MPGVANRRIERLLVAMMKAIRRITSGSTSLNESKERIKRPGNLLDESVMTHKTQNKYIEP
jgi:hypothetical protein